MKSFAYSQYGISARRACGGRSDAIRRFTSNLADLFGIGDRGRLLPCLAADIANFDPQTVGSSNRGERRYDLPGGGKRMVMPSRGVRYDRERRYYVRRRRACRRCGGESVAVLIGASLERTAPAPFLWQAA